MSEEERKFYEATVHNLRSSGWTRLEAEDEALSRLEKSRQELKEAKDRNPDNA